MRRNFDPRLKRLENRVGPARPIELTINFVNQNGSVVETLCIAGAKPDYTGVPQERVR